MNLAIAIRRNTDGKTASTVWRDWEWSGDFWWADGNAACDCNRALFFARALGEPDPDAECGDSLYSVRLTDADTGELLYQDMDHA